MCDDFEEEQPYKEVIKRHKEKTIHSINFVKQSEYIEENSKKLDYDVTTSYLTSPFVAERVAKEIPNVKIIVLLRNPTSRAWSDYNASQKKDASEEEFQTYIDDELQELESSDFEEKVSKNNNNMSEPFSNFIKKGIYAIYLKNWLKFMAGDYNRVTWGEALRSFGIVRMNLLIIFQSWFCN